MGGIIMTMVEKQEEKVKTGKESKTKYRVFPDIYRDIDYDNQTVEVEIALPGVSKENIALKALPGWFQISASRDEIEYCGNSGWGADIVPEKTTAEYKEGLLKIHAKIRNPLDDAKTVSF